MLYRRINAFTKFLFLTVFSVYSLVASAEIVLTDNFEAIAKRTLEYGKLYGRENVLVVYDIDNTILASNQDLGSDQWFDWQAGLISARSEQAVASDLGGLLEIQKQLYSLGKMHRTYDYAHQVVNGLQRLGFASLILTARGNDNRDATMREVRKNGYDFTIRTIGPQSGFPGSYLPFSLGRPEDAGLSKDEIEQWKISAPRPVGFEDGVYMVSGQHKGAMLRALLAKTQNVFKSIVFVDDKQKNVLDMEQAYANSDLAITSFRFTGEDDAVARFEGNDKSIVNAQWQNLRSILGVIFPN